MAVVQISRIQVRRGKENSGSGLPQLASGEMAWSVDAQNLWIGNGSVAEGAPNVGNTKILTANDLGSNGNILDLITFQYKKNDYSIVTSSLGPNYPIIRPLQDRLDDAVSVMDFGATGDGVTDDTAALQLAINELFLNPINVTNKSSRKTLIFPAGTYITTTTLYVPSYATLIGYGIGKTTIQYNNTASAPGPVIQFVNDTATPGVPNIFSMPLVERPTYNPIGSSGTTLKLTRTDALAGTTGISVGMVITGTGFSGAQTVTAIVDSQTVTISLAPNGTPSGVLIFTATQAPAPTYISQPKNIQVSNMSLYTNTSDQAGLQLDAVRDSRFENLEITGAWALLANEYSRGIYLTAFSRLVTCQRNLFKNIQIAGFTYGILSNNDIYNNAFTDLYVTNCRQGVALGKTSNRTSTGQQYGPCNTTFTDSIFENIKQQAVYIYLGSGNTTRNTRLINVGNDGGSNTTSAQYPQIYFAVAGNSSQYDQSDRGDDLATVIPSVNTTYTASGSSGTVLNVASTTGISVGMSIAGTGFNPLVSPYTWTVQSISSNVQVIISSAPNGTPSGVLTFSVPYYPEVSGLVSYDSHSVRQVNITNPSTSTFAFRLPLPTDGVNYVINYVYRSTVLAISRRGTITIMCDVINNSVQLSDEYDYTGRNDGTYDVNLAFTARIITNSLEIDYINNSVSDAGLLMYSYSAVL
jgi:hypothetical protein